MRWLLLVATIWPLIYSIAFTVLLVQAVTGGSDAIATPAIIPVHVLAFATTIALAIYYVRDVFRRELPEERRTIWAVLMCLFGSPAMLVYWWRYLRRTTPHSAAKLMP